jgi:Cof subfamily protein (haloacid dehalogenase superfamily)
LSTFFLTDLDGTLLRSDATLSDYTIQIICNALNKGIVISYATARSLTSSHKIVSIIPWKHPIILYNGAAIYDPLTKTFIGGRWLDMETTNQVIELGRKHSLTPFLFALDQEDNERVLHEPLTRDGDLQFFKSRPNDPRFNELACLECPPSIRTLIITYIGRLEELEPLRAEVVQQFGEHVHVHLMKDNYIEDHYFLEFSHQQANKKEGLKQWAALTGCEPKDISVFGDNLNDIGMFEAAGTKIAVANAHTHLLKLSSLVVESNDGDGVARYIARSLESVG